MELKEPPTLKGLDFSKEKIEEVRVNDRLLSIGTEPSLKCNLRCPYCYNASGKPVSNELTKGEVFDLVDQAVDLGAETIRVLGGEPTILNYFTDLLYHIKSRGAQPLVFTNEIVLGNDNLSKKIHGMSSKDLVGLLNELDVLVIAKLNCPPVSKRDARFNYYSQLQEMLTGGLKGSYEKMVKGIESLIEAGLNKKEPTRLAVESIVINLNYGSEILDLWRWARKNNIIPYIELTKSAGRAKGFLKNVELRRVLKERLFTDLLLIDEKEFGYTWIPKPPLAAMSCQQHLYSVYVNSQGEVQPCSSLNFSVGNIRNEKLAEIIKKPAIKMMREIKDHIEGGCKTCAYGEECYGCRGNAYQLTGNPFAEDPDCWYYDREDLWQKFNENLVRQNLKLLTGGMPNQKELIEKEVARARRDYESWRNRGGYEKYKASLSRA